MEVKEENQKTQTQIPQHSAFIVKTIEEVEVALKKLTRYSHIFLIGNFNYFNLHVTVINNENMYKQASILYGEMFQKRLVNIIPGTDCYELKDKIMELIQLEREFCFGGGGLCSIENFWNNLYSIANCPNTSVLKDLLKDKPVILVSSGPSLTEDIPKLKECQDKAIIIACSTAVSVLYKNDIIPHFVVVIDPYPIMDKFILPYVTEKTILLAANVIDNNIIKDYPGPIIYFYTSGGLQVVGNLLQDLKIKEGVLSSAAVTTAALSLALFMNASKIIFLGQDMCFEDKVHAEDVEETPYANVCEVTTLFDGRKVKTLSVYKAVSDYLNSFVPRLQDTKEVYNCAVNGVGIMGAKNVPFDKVILNEIIEMPKIENNNIIDKSQVLSKIVLIRNDLLELLKYLDIFKNYINTLVENKINDEFIFTEVNEFFDNVREKPGYYYSNMFSDWIWYLLLIAQTIEDKVSSLTLFENVLNKIVYRINGQIELMSNESNEEMAV